MSNIHESIFEINLELIKQNINYLKKKLNSNTQIIAVIKAYAYGHGDIEISKYLEKINIDSFWVADFEEGIILRKNGIIKPIIVANASPKSINQIIKYKLDVVVYNFRLLDILIKSSEKINIHLKFNCGMNRFGFSINDIKKIKEYTEKYKHLKVRSICSHLSSANDKKRDAITQKEFSIFDQICERFGTKIYKHILNTNGIIRFPQKQYDAVRVGIGILGINQQPRLKQIGKLTTTISQIRTIKKNEYIGYGGRFKSTKTMKIGIIPFGYADGLDKKLGNQNGQLYADGKKCNILGEISMDSCVIDLTNTKVKEGDRVEVFGPNNSIVDICKKINSTPYEFLSSINRRIKRIYI
ncbi:MAG: alanine racemase [Flavobacteriales bacterium]